MEPMKFSWFPKFSEVLASIPEEGMQAEFCRAVVMYGAFGEEPELPWPLDAIFKAIREDIDNSVRSCNANSGGRPKAQDEGVSDTVKPGVTDASEPGVSEDVEPGVSDTVKQGVIEDGKPLLNKPNQTMPSQTKPEGGGAPRPSARRKRTRFSPPTEAECREYAVELGMDAEDGSEFHDHFSANGWKVSGKAAMKDWRASLRNWMRRKPQFERFKPPEQRAPSEPLPTAQNAVDWEAEAARLGVDLDG